MVSRSAKGLAAIAAVAALVLTGCSGGSPTTAPGGSAPSGSDEPFIYYFSTSATGPLAGTSTATLEVTKLAIEDINASGGMAGHPVELVIQDDKLDTQTAITLFQEQLDKQVPNLAHIGNTSNMALALLPQATQNKVLSTGLVQATPISDGNTYPYMYVPYIEGKYDAATLGAEFEKQGYTHVTSLTANDANGQSTLAALEEDFAGRGISIVNETYAPTDTTVTAQLTRLKEQNPEALVIQAYGAIAGVILKDRTTLGWETPAYGTSALGVGQNLGLISTAADWKNLSVAVFPALAGQSPNQAAFDELLANLKSAGSKLDQPTHFYTQYWDFLHIVQKAAEQAGAIDADSLKAAMDDLKPNAEIDAKLVGWSADTYKFTSSYHFLNTPDPSEGGVLIVVPAGPLVEGVIQEQ